MGIVLKTRSYLVKIYSTMTERRLYPRYGLALTRIGYAIAILITLLTNVDHWSLFWGEGRPWNGIDMPGQTTLSDSNSFVLAIIAVCSSASLTMLLGLYSRTSSFVVWITYLILMRSDPLISDGGDNVLQICLLFLVFTRCGDRLSIDALRKKKRAASIYSRVFSNGAWLLIVIQTMVLYATSGLAKVPGESWRSGEAIAFTLRSVEYSPWPSFNEWISSLHTPLVVAAYTTVLLQVYFPFLVLNKRTKGITIIAMMLFHLGIGLFMGLTSFAIVMIATEMCFISDRFFGRFFARLSGRGRSTSMISESPPELPSSKSVQSA